MKAFDSNKREALTSEQLHIDEEKQRIKELIERYKNNIKGVLPNHFSANKRMKMQSLTLKEVKINGLPKEIFWKQVELNINTVEGMSSGRLCEIGHHINYLASQFVVYEQRILRDYEGDLYEVEHEQLVNVFKRSLERTITVFAQSVGKFLERNEIAGEVALIASSIRHVYEENLKYYQLFVANRPNYALVKNTEDAWLERDSYFMGETLRTITQPPIILSEAAPFYNEEELKVAGAFYQSAKKWLITQKSTAVSEEQLGIELGIFAMKAVALMQKQTIRCSFKDKIKRAYFSFYRYKIDDINKRQQEMSDHIYNRDKKMYAPLDEKVVHMWTTRLYDYAKQRDIAGAFLEGIPDAFSEFKHKVEQGSRLQRYQRSNDWFHFYSDSKTIKHEHSDAFSYRLRIEDWALFVARLALEDQWVFDPYTEA